MLEGFCSLVLGHLCWMSTYHEVYHDTLESTGERSHLSSGFQNVQGAVQVVLLAFDLLVTLQPYN